MSEGLGGYQVIGPAKLREEDVAALRAKLVRLHVYITECDSKGVECDAGEIESILGDELVYDRAEDTLNSDLAAIPDAAALDAFVEWWDGGCRSFDVASRSIPDAWDDLLGEAKLIVFAGGTTYGDSPEGEGYQHLENAYIWGFKHLGIV